MEGSDEERGLLSSPGSLLETVHHLLLRGAHGSNPIQWMCTCMRMHTCACLKSVSEATPCSFGSWRNCGVQIKGWPAQWCSRGDVTTQPSPLCRGGRLLLAAPLSPLTMHCPLHIPARKKWLRPRLSCVYDWEALRDGEWHLQGFIKRRSPQRSASASGLDGVFSAPHSLGAAEGRSSAGGDARAAAASPALGCLHWQWGWWSFYRCAAVFIRVHFFFAGLISSIYSSLFVATKDISENSRYIFFFFPVIFFHFSFSSPFMDSMH